MLRSQYFVVETIRAKTLFDNGRAVIHMATMNKADADVKLASLKKSNPEKSEKFKIERKLINVN